MSGWLYPVLVLATFVGAVLIASIVGGWLGRLARGRRVTH